MRTISPIRVRHLVACASAALALAAMPSAVAAQQSIPGVVVEAVTRPELERALQLEAQAILDERTPRGWRDAAGRYSRAAELRGSSIEATSLYRRAAWLYSASGDHDKGRQQLERAARIALDRGDVVHAANTLFDAALMAATARDVRNTDATLARLAVLLDAPLMPSDVRTGIQQRLAEPARVARR